MVLNRAGIAAAGPMVNKRFGELIGVSEGIDFGNGVQWGGPEGRTKGGKPNQNTSEASLT